MFRKLLDKYLSFNIFNFTDSQSFDMEESIEKTNKTLEKYPHYNRTLINYISGNCYYNGKISHNYEVNENDLKESSDLDDLILKTQPMSKSLHLFHGFEPGIRYDDNNWKMGHKIVIPFHLSKTPAFWVAERFTNHWNWLLEKKKLGLFKSIPACYNMGLLNAFKTLFFRKYLFCIYDQSEGSWHHVSTDIRCPQDLLKYNKMLINNEEFEYLSHKNEKFVLVDIIYKYNFWFPFINKFYVLRRITN